MHYSISGVFSRFLLQFLILYTILCPMPGSFVCLKLKSTINYIREPAYDWL